MYLLANSPNLFERLQDMLSSPNQEINCEIWKLLVNLPPNESYLSRMRDLPLTYIDLNDYLQMKSDAITGKHAYCCYILKLVLEELANQSDKLKTYLQTLKNLKGFRYFLDLLKGSLKEARSKISLKCLTYSSYGVNIFIRNVDCKAIFAEIDGQKEMWSSLDKINKEILNGCNIKGGEYEKLLSVTEQCDLLGNTALLQIYLASISPAELLPEILNEKYFQDLKQGLFNANNEFREKVCEILTKIWEEDLINSPKEKSVEFSYSNLLFGAYLEHAIEKSEKALNYFALLKAIIVNSI